MALAKKYRLPHRLIIVRQAQECSRYHLRNRSRRIITTARVAYSQKNCRHGMLVLRIVLIRQQDTKRRMVGAPCV